MAMGANFSFELTFNETCAPKFNGHNKLFLASVIEEAELVVLLFILVDISQTLQILCIHM